MNARISKIKYPKLNAFDFSIKYNETDRKSHVREIDLHLHKECEIYINLSGDVSFIVENRLYPLRRGDVIVSRPGDYHHCVYHSDAAHALYWILFDTKGNEALFTPLFDRLLEYGSLISPSNENRERLISLCEKLLLPSVTEVERYATFFSLISILESTDKKSMNEPNALPHDIGAVLEYIDAHLPEPLTSEVLAQISYTSKSTLERRFSKILGMRTAAFIRKRRLLAASQLLEKGYSVLEAGQAVGYSDNSNFIKRFCEYYGITPFQYKKKYVHKNKKSIAKSDDICYNDGNHQE